MKTQLKDGLHFGFAQSRARSYLHFYLYLLYQDVASVQGFRVSSHAYRRHWRLFPAFPITTDSASVCNPRLRWLTDRHKSSS